MNKNLLKLVFAGAVLSLLAGCIVLSVYPFYTDKDLISDPALAGRWVKSGSTNEFWQFTPAGEKAFNLAAVDPNSTNGFEAHVFQLE